MEDVLEKMVECAEKRRNIALASLVWSSGSIPMSDRAKMLVLDDGQLVGTIGGGCLEAEVYSAGTQVLQDGQPRDLRYTMTEKQAGESGLNCGGTVRIYTQLVAPETIDSFYAQVVRGLQARSGSVLFTELIAREKEHRHILFAADGEQWGTLGSPILDQWAADHVDEVVARGRGKLLRGPGEDEGEYFVEPYLPPPVLFIFGGGHVGGQVCRLAKNVGFHVVLIDDRPAFASAELHPDADECFAGDIEEIFPQLPIDEQSYILALTRGHEYDELVVEKAIATEARYVGMLGSERKKLVLWKRIAGRGGSREKLAEVYAPVGANIGADTPEEIAVSVLAELIQVRRGVRKVWKTKRAEVVV